MAKLLGPSRNIKLSWLNETVRLVWEGLSDEEIYDKLKEYLKLEITSQTNAKKTREILVNLWVRKGETDPKVRNAALDLIKKYPEYALAVHWCMLLYVYPVFRDACKYIGKMGEFQDEIILAQLKQRLFDEWGERTTLYYSIDKLLATFRDFNVIKRVKPGRYYINKRDIRNQEIVAFMVYVMLLVDNGSYCEYLRLNSASYYFPFDYRVDKEMLCTDERFTLSNFNGKLCIALKS